MWFFKDIILVVWLVIMAVIVVVNAIGTAFDIQQIRENIAYWGLTWFEFLFLILGVAFLVVVIRLIQRLNRLEKARPEIEIYPNSLAGMEITLVVHNKSQVKADISAVMTCAIDSGELMEDDKINGLRNVSMCWEASGRANETINPGGKKILKLCSARRYIYGDEQHTHMEYSKVESDSEQVVACAHRSDGEPTPKVNVDIQLDSSITKKGKQSWRYQVFYLGDTDMIGIYDLNQSGSKSYIRKGVRLD